MESSKRKHGLRHCFVPGCTTGYSSNKSKTSLFLVPKDADRLRLWAKVIPRADKVLDQFSAVCELHFEPRFIEKNYSFIIGGRKVLIPRGKPLLLPEAIPSIFPNLPNYLSKTISKKHTLKQKGKPLPKKMKVSDNPNDFVECVSNSTHTPKCNDELSALESFCSVTLPSEFWVQIKYEQAAHTICFASWYSCDDEMPDKRVLVKLTSNQTFMCTIYFKSVLVNEKEIFSSKDLQYLLEEVHSKHICVGAGKLEEFLYISPKKVVIEGDVYKSIDCFGKVDKNRTSCAACKYKRKLLLNQRGYSNSRNYLNSNCDGRLKNDGILENDLKSEYDARLRNYLEVVKTLKQSCV